MMGWQELVIVAVAVASLVGFGWMLAIRHHRLNPPAPDAPPAYRVAAPLLRIGRRLTGETLMPTVPPDRQRGFTAWWRSIER